MTRNEILKLLAAHRGELHERFGVASLALFGSFAREQAGERSDVDVLVEFDRPITLFDLVALQLELEALLGVPKVDVVLRDSIFPELREAILGEAIHVL